MKSVIKLKDDARKHELKEDWEKAIQVYLQVVHVGEQGETDLELPLYNRIGDLYVRLGRSDDAVNYYEQAADRYAEAGLFNNAIALCNKALRYAPDHLGIIRKLGQFSASQGFLTDARRWFVDFAERASRQGQVDEALSALEDFANISDDADVREMLGRRLHQHGRNEAAVAELKRAYGMHLRAGDDERAAALRTLVTEIDPDVDLESEPTPAFTPHGHDSQALPSYADAATVFEPPADSGLLEGFEATHVGEAEPTEAVDLSLAGLEPTAAPPEEPTPASRDEIGLDETGPADETSILEGFEPTAFDTEPEDELGSFDLPTLDDTDTASADAAAFDAGLEDSGFDLPSLDDQDTGFDLPLLGEEEAEADDAFELPMLEGSEGEAGTGAEGEAQWGADAGTEGEAEWGAEAEAEAGLEADAEAAGEGEPLETFTQLPPIEEPEPEAAAESDEDVLAGAREAVAAGDVAGGTEALGMVQGRLSDPASYVAAAGLAAQLLERHPDEVRLHQLRVEFAEQADDTALRLSAYLELAAALDRTDAPNKARAMYQHVLDLDPGNDTARKALGLGTAAEPAAAPEYVDLASLIDMDNEPSGDTRYFVEETEPTGDEDHDFAELLAQFKAKVSENVSAEDAGAHYDLGLAFKEMGLVDEAIGEFQVALRAGDERLKIYEELGQCFMMKEQYNVAAKVFGRALQMPYDDELELIGVYYHLGRALEELGRPADAREAYERVLTLDINFQDVSSRLARL